MAASHISSRANPLLKEVRRAIQRGGLTADGCCVAESFHLLEEALRSGCDVRAVLAAEPAEEAVARLVRRRKGLRHVVLPEALFNALAATDSPQGVLALVRPPVWTAADVLAGEPVAVVVDGVQDPGNAGAILRAAEAFGASGAFFLKGTVSPYNPKALRASAGSVFRIPAVGGMDPAAVRNLLEEHGVPWFVADAHAGAPPDQAVLRPPCVLVIGGESRGAGMVLGEGAPKIHIPISGVESLNAAMAAGILLYEAARQRRVLR
jgi:TrmH family RNA methyltransferase